MKVRRPSCWLIQWDKSRVDTNERFSHIAGFCDFVGTLPSAMSANRVGDILSALVMSHVPASIAFKVDHPRPGRRRILLGDGSTVSGALPKVYLSKDHPADVECELGRLRLVARRVTDLVVTSADDGVEILSWTEPSRFYGKQNQLTGEITTEEIMPKRRREKKFNVPSHPFH